MRRLFRLPALTALALTFVLSACEGGGGPTVPVDGAAGTYTLRTVNAAALPVPVFQSAATRVDITSGTMVLRSDGSFTETWQLKVVHSAGGTETDQRIMGGTYATTGTMITFTVPASEFDPAYSHTGAISGRDLSYSFRGIAPRYQKQ